MAVILELFRWLKERPRRFSYRAVLGPEHFGTVFYLARMPKADASGSSKASLSRWWDSTHRSFCNGVSPAPRLIDRVATHVLREDDPQLKTGDFRTIVGNDETVWEPPGIEIPFASLSRCFHPGYFAEYHTSRDDLSLNRVDKLEETLEMLKRMVEVFEEDGTIERRFEGLMALSNPKYGLYIERPDPTVAKNLSAEDLVLGRIQNALPRYLDRALDRIRDRRAASRPVWPVAPTSRPLCRKGAGSPFATDVALLVTSTPARSDVRASEHAALHVAVLGSANVRVLRLRSRHKRPSFCPIAGWKRPKRLRAAAAATAGSEFVAAGAPAARRGHLLRSPGGFVGPAPPGRCIRQLHPGGRPRIR